MRPVILFAALLMAAVPAVAEDKIEIKLDVKKGLKFTKEQSFSGDGDCKLGGEEGGPHLAFKVKMSGEVKQLEEVLDAKAGVPVEVRRQYPKRSTEIDMAMFGRKDTVAHPLEGAEITFGPKGKAGMGPEGAIAAEALATEEPADPLTMMVASGKVVAAGNSWDADKSRVKAWLSSEIPGFSTEDAEITVKLAEFREKDGQKCVRLEIEGTAKGKLSTGQGPESPADLTIEGDVFYRIDAGIVISMKVKGELKGELPIQNGGNQANLAIKIPYELKSTVKIGEAEFGAKPTEKPKPKKPEPFPPPVR